MSRIGKALVPILGVLAGLAMVVAAVAIVLQIQERDKRIVKESELRVALAENDDLSAQLTEIKNTASRLEEDLSYVRRELQDVQGELTEVSNANKTLTKSVEDREREIERIAKDLEQARTEKEDLSKQLVSFRADQQALQERMGEITLAKEELESKVLELSEYPTVELDKVVVSSLPLEKELDIQAPTPSALLGGQVIVVNREYDFIVMNIGKNQGLLIGQEFHIIRGDEVLGKVKVEKVYDELSAAAILPESDKARIQEGDAVKSL